MNNNTSFYNKNSFELNQVSDNDKIRISYNFYSNPTFCNKVFFQNMKENFYENYYDNFVKFSNKKNINIKPTHEIKQKTFKFLQKLSNEIDTSLKASERIN